MKRFGLTFIPYCVFWLTCGLVQAQELTAFGGVQTYAAAKEETLLDIARAHKIGFVEMRAANPDVDPWLPGEGREITIPAHHLLPDAPREGLVVNLGEMRLYYFEEKGQPPVTFPIGVGRDGMKTPLGQTTIERKTEGPNWYPTPRMRREDPTLPKVVKAGANNPLGSHALYLGWPTYLIHGTNKPWGVGRRVSSGCIRLYPEDIANLFTMVPKGTKVTVVDQPVKFGWIGGELFMEAHPSKGQADALEMKGSFEHRLEDGFSAAVIKAAGDQTQRLDWRAIREAVMRRSGLPVQVTR